MHIGSSVQSQQKVSTENSYVEEESKVVVDLNQKVFEGWLIKHVRKLKFLQTTRFPKRYFYLD
jgi:hypothetical protein